jgi:simple sugar transport system permease protein
VRIQRRLTTPQWLTVAVPAASLVAALAASAVVLLAAGKDPIASYARLFDRGFIAPGALTGTLVTATPLLLTGLAAATAFRMKLWNIGAEGQLYLGAVGATGVVLALHSHPGVIIIAGMILGGLLSGAIWAIVPGLLRAYFNTNEIITTLMLNYVAGLLLSYLIFDSQSYWRDLSTFSARAFPQGKVLPDAAAWPSFNVGFDPGVVVLGIVLVAGGFWIWRQRRHVLTDWNQRGFGIALAVALAAALLLLAVGSTVAVTVPFGFVIGVITATLLWIFYGSTSSGFEARVLGDSPSAARYSGIKTRRVVVGIMSLSGALAGLGGASEVGDFRHVLDPRGLQQAGLGYAGIVVAALARYNPFAVALVALLLGGLANAGYSLQGPDFPAGLVGVLQGMILFFALGGELLLRYRISFGTRRIWPPRAVAVAAGEVGVTRS